MDEDYTKAKEENLKNPKNRFLGLFCHANEVDNSWGCNWSFTTGVVIFSIIRGLSSLCDVYYIAGDNFFVQAEGHPVYQFFFFVQILSDLCCLISIGIACFSINRNSYCYSIVSYYAMVFVLLLHSIFCLANIIFIFDFEYLRIVTVYLISWGIQEFGLILFSWILFCNQVFIARQRRNVQTSQ